MTLLYFSGNFHCGKEGKETKQYWKWPTISFLLLLYSIFFRQCSATITVGGSNGWTTGFDYDSWAKGQAFTTKDVLLFNYGPSHSLDEVSDIDYKDCNTDNPISSYSSSPTSIPLSSTGTRYFICPTSTHCSWGMKLAVTITNVSSTGTPPPSATIPPPPPTSSTSSPPPSTTASPPPTSSTSSPPPGTTPTPSPSIVPKPSPPHKNTAPSPKSNSTHSSPPPGSSLAPTNAPPPVPSHGTILANTLNSMFIGMLLVMATLFGLIG